MWASEQFKLDWRAGCLGEEKPRERGRGGGIRELRETERTDTQREGWEAVLKNGVVGGDQMNSVVVVVGDGCGREVEATGCKEGQAWHGGVSFCTLNCSRRWQEWGTGIQGSW